MIQIWTTRTLFPVAMFTAIACSAVLFLAPKAQAADPVKVALLAPLSGPWAKQGELMKMGAELAIKDINAAGGIKSLGGAPMQLVLVDAGDSTEKAKNAAQRMISEYPDLVGVTCCWLSSFTLAASEVTERAGLPMVTESYSDALVDRGFKYIFQTAPTAKTMVDTSIPAMMALAQSVTGAKPKSTGMIGDNSAAGTAASKPLHDIFEKMGIELKFDQVYSPPLTDATALIQQVRTKKPEFLMMAASNVADAKVLLEKFNEFGLSAKKLPIISNGGAMGLPSLLANVGADPLEGLMSTVANWGHKGQEDIIARFKAATGEPWMTQDSINTYGDIELLKYALEKAGKADKEAVAAALHTVDTSEGPAHYYSGTHLKFDETGRNVGAKLVIIQWQKGVPVTVFPPEIAVAAPIWPK